MALLSFKCCTIHYIPKKMWQLLGDKKWFSWFSQCPFHIVAFWCFRVHLSAFVCSVQCWGDAILWSNKQMYFIHCMFSCIHGDNGDIIFQQEAFHSWSSCQITFDFKMKFSINSPHGAKLLKLQGNQWKYDFCWIDDIFNLAFFGPLWIVRLSVSGQAFYR